MYLSQGSAGNHAKHFYVKKKRCFAIFLLVKNDSGNQVATFFFLKFSLNQPSVVSMYWNIKFKQSLEWFPLLRTASFFQKLFSHYASPIKRSKYCPYSFFLNGCANSRTFSLVSIAHNDRQFPQG